MGSVVKKIKKTVKKIVKKNPITKIIKKVGKGIKKLGGKMWEGIKKVGGKALKAFSKFSNKLGPIGMIALSFAMPYLAGGFMSGWNAMGSWLGSTASAGTGFMNTMAQVGHGVWKGISTAGSFVKGTYQGITQTLGKTFKAFGNGSVKEGFGNLWGGTKDVFTGKAGFGTQEFATKNIMMGAHAPPGMLPSSTQVMSSTGNLVPGASGVVNTGGVSAFNANQLNVQSYKHIQNAMAQTKSLYSPEMDKYVNTIQNQYNVDAFTAHEHAMSNGGVSTGGNYQLDFAKSGDFTNIKSGQASGWEYTGNAGSTSFSDNGMNYIGVNEKGLDVVGNTYNYGQSSNPSLLNRTKEYGKKALSALSVMNDDQPLPMGGAGVSTALDPFGSRYGGTDVASAGGGQFLTEEQKKFFANQNLNIQGA